MDEATGKVEDLATLTKLDENILLNELKKRYSQDDIYTYVGDILVAFNPFRDLGIYGNEFSRKYNMSKKNSQPPHIFAIADTVYQDMMGLRGTLPRNQCLLISGESGAGKTESTKLVIRQLVELCRGNTHLEQQILQVNPLLEALGNAKTLMNDNSSRFGKYIQLKFLHGQLLGGKINEYLLEKSRVVRQNSGEENFHIFYYMFAGLSAEERKNYKLHLEQDYKYFSNGIGDFTKSFIRYKQEYMDLVNAMDMVGFTDEEQENMFKVLASVLNIGNIEFTENEDGEAILTNKSYVEDVTSLLKLQHIDDLTDCITHSTTATHGEVIIRNYTIAQATDARDAITKVLYGRLFSWVINKINSLLATMEGTDSDKVQEIGILDIFGFEHFERNSFEQACINLANEQLQFFFNKHVFSLEQEEYIKEGIDWKEIQFKDNQQILDLFTSRPVGILALLDEESQFPQATDQTFVNKLRKNFDKNCNFIQPRQAHRPCFTIVHYAGQVLYNATDWLEKNRDTTPAGVMPMLQNCHNSLVRLIFNGKITRTGTLALQNRSSKGIRRSTKHKAKMYARIAKERKLTVSHQFKNSLQVLMEKMTASRPVFIRCIKPNNNKAAHLFDDAVVEKQLLYTGMLETTKIRRDGYAVRPLHAEFVESYKLIANQMSMKPDNNSCIQILKVSGLKNWHVGKTKVFLKYWHLEKLMEQMEEKSRQVVKIQKVVRGFLGRQYFLRCRKQAEEEAKLLESLRKKIEESALQNFQNQVLKIGEDEKKSKGTGIYPTLPEPVEYAVTDDIVTGSSDVQQTQQSDKPARVSFGQQTEQIENDCDSDSDDVFEDEFVPVKSADMNKYGKAGTRQASVRWFKETQSVRVKENSGNFAEWFHGIIKRSESEELLKNRPVGCFLIRVSESRFGYSLSFKAEDRVRHYMIDQTPTGKYIILGEPKVHKSLFDLVSFHQKVKLSNWNGLLTTVCGQEDGRCDYEELMGDTAVYHELENVADQPQLIHGQAPPLPERMYSKVSDINIGQRPLPQIPQQAYQRILQNQAEQPHTAIGKNKPPGKTRLSTTRGAAKQK